MVEIKAASKESQSQRQEWLNWPTMKCSGRWEATANNIQIRQWLRRQRWQWRRADWRGDSDNQINRWSGEGDIINISDSGFWNRRFEPSDWSWKVSKYLIETLAHARTYDGCPNIVEDLWFISLSKMALIILPQALSTGLSNYFPKLSMINTYEGVFFPNSPVMFPWDQ